MTRTGWTTGAAVALALALAGCGSSDGAESASEGGSDPSATATSSSEGPDATEGGEGTALVDGLVVPAGAHLAGAVFRRPDPALVYVPVPLVEEVPETITPPELGSTTSTTTTTSPLPRPDPAAEGAVALLVLDDGDPFTVWDAMAAQVREIGIDMSGSAESCRWRRGDVLAPVVEGEPAWPIERLECEATGADGRRLVTLTLVFGGDHPGSLLLETGPAQWATPPGDPAPVDDSVRDLLPDPAAPEDPAPGGPFGGVGNCFVAGYTRFPLPAGATLEGTEGGPDGASVLAVDDVDAAIVELATASRAGDASYSPPQPRDLPLADGRSVRHDDIVIDAGGGACDFLGSPDGGHLLVTMWSD